MISRALRTASLCLPFPGRWHTSADIESNVRRVGRLLRSFGLDRGRTRAFLGELRADLADAAANGAPLESVLGNDLKAFAGQVAEAHGRAPVPSRIALIVFAMGAPLLFVGAATYIAIGGGENLGLDYYTISLTTHEQVRVADGSTRTVEVEYGEGWRPLLVYGVAAFVGVASAFALTAGLLRVLGDPRLGETLRRLLIILPVAGAAGVGAAMLLGNATGYSTARSVILAEAVLVAVTVVMGIAVAREWARRLPHPFAQRDPRLLER